MTDLDRRINRAHELACRRGCRHYLWATFSDAGEVASLPISRVRPSPATVGESWLVVVERKWVLKISSDAPEPGTPGVVWPTMTEDSDGHDDPEG